MLHKRKSPHKRADGTFVATLAERYCPTHAHEIAPMTEHTKTDGLPGMDMPVVAEAGSSAFGKAPPRNER
jgi:hypothetical protein